MPNKKQIRLNATMFVNGEGTQKRFEIGDTLDHVKDYAHAQDAEALEVAHAPYLPENYRYYVLNPTTLKWNRVGLPRIRAVVGRVQHLIAESGVKTRPAKHKRTLRAIYEMMPGISPGPGESRDRDRRRGHPGHGPDVNRHTPSTSYPIGALRG